jgi:arsenate reductase
MNHEKGKYAPDSFIVFVCEHGAAKSVIAAAYFNKLAAETDSDVRAIARGTDPDQELSSKAITGLREDGLLPAETLPQKLSLADVESAQRIVTFCELPEDYQEKAIIERWNGVPPVSENYEKARDEIVERINRLMKQQL